jgi:hypothetical protein
MQIEADQSVCPACGAAALGFFPVLHHLICAYMGPEYDFIPTADGYACPKCRHDIVAGDAACEIVGASARCGHCGREMVVSPLVGPAADANLRETTSRALAGLTPREQGVLRLRLGIGPGSTVADAARRCAMSSERIRRIEARALRKLSRTPRGREPPSLRA